MQIVGVLGWLDTVLSNYIYKLYYCLFILSILFYIYYFKLDTKLFILSSCVILSCIFLIFFALYITWTPMNSSAVEGVQGRYFIPLLPLINLFFISRRKENNTIIRNINSLLYITIFVNLYVIFPYIYFTRYWF